jgi:hypothetical protein
MAFIAHHFHWSRDAVMGLDHQERRRWCREISAINRTLDGSTKTTDLFNIGSTRK